MELSLSFGAVGDIIAICGLVKGIAAALDDARGSAKHYRDLIEHLHIIARTITEIDRVFQHQSRTSGLDSLHSLAVRTAEQISETLGAFNAKIKKFHPSLSQSGSGNRFRDAARKVQWKIEERDVDKLRMEMMGYSSSLQILLQAASLHVNQHGHSETHGRLDSIMTQTRALVRGQTQGLQQCASRIKETLSGRIGFVIKIGLDLKKTTDRILAIGLDLRKELQVLRGLVFQIERPFADEHFILEDAVGRTYPVHLRTITTWDALQSVLEQQFRGRSGERRVARKRYALHDESNGRQISDATDWAQAFRPRQRVVMSIFCAEKEVEGNTQETTSCPRCFAVSPGDCGTSVNCHKCHFQFRRMTEIEDSASASSQVQKIPTHGQSLCGRRGKSEKILGHFENRKRRIDATYSDQSDEDDFADFARVVFTSKRRRVSKRPGFKKDSSASRVRSRKAIAVDRISDDVVRRNEMWSGLQATQLPPFVWGNLNLLSSCALITLSDLGLLAIDFRSGSGLTPPAPSVPLASTSAGATARRLNRAYTCALCEPVRVRTLAFAQ
ncbi:hypothetical protein MFIFM68171_05007 [Madurella fahalii]|uniref:Ubiquitin-like domain-containing protein n=1 Tax=Madurella fahalii TaxID=1157608 RepID=A0ABQ0GAJ8_9PEZI